MVTVGTSPNGNLGDFLRMATVMRPGDVLVIPGNLGLVGYSWKVASERALVRYMSNKPWTLAVVEGDREPIYRLRSLPSIERPEFTGATVGRIGNNVVTMNIGDPIHVLDDVVLPLSHYAPSMLPDTIEQPLTIVSCHSCNRLRTLLGMPLRDASTLDDIAPSVSGRTVRVWISGDIHTPSPVLDVDTGTYYMGMGRDGPPRVCSV